MLGTCASDAPTLRKHCYLYTISDAFTSRFRKFRELAMVAHDDPRLAKVGFAKLVGSGIELYTKKHEITLGRLSKSGHVDVVLGKSRCMCSAVFSPAMPLRWWTGTSSFA